MVHPTVQPSLACSTLPEAETAIRAYRLMLLARVLDDKFASLYRTGKIQGGVFLGRGQEALSVASGMALKPGDVFAPLIRDAAGRLAFGETVLDAVRTFLGSRLGPMRGRDGNVHRGRPQQGMLAMISHLGAMISVVNGVLLSRRFQGIEGSAGLASLGDGATSTGAFHEALNQAAVEKLPLVVVVANNQYAYSTPNQRQFACKSLLDRAQGYGVQPWAVDGTSLVACLDALGRAVDCARRNESPQLVVASLLRLCGHGEHDDASYIDPAVRSSPVSRDCLQVAEHELLQNGWASAADFPDWRKAAVGEVEDSVGQVQHEPPPDLDQEEWSALSARHLVEGQGN